MIVAVLEDCPAQRDWVTKLLHDRGHQVVARGDGDSFIALLRSQVVDAALLDWEVPGASGLSVLSWARSNLNRSMPILMLTQRDDEDDVVTALNAGADDYLHKRCASASCWRAWPRRPGVPAMPMRRGRSCRSAPMRSTCNRAG